MRRECPELKKKLKKDKFTFKKAKAMLATWSDEDADEDEQATSGNEEIQCTTMMRTITSSLKREKKNLMKIHKRMNLKLKLLKHTLLQNNLLKYKINPDLQQSQMSDQASRIADFALCIYLSTDKDPSFNSQMKFLISPTSHSSVCVHLSTGSIKLSTDTQLHGISCLSHNILLELVPAFHAPLHLSTAGGSLPWEVQQTRRFGAVLVGPFPFSNTIQTSLKGTHAPSSFFITKSTSFPPQLKTLLLLDANPTLSPSCLLSSVYLSLPFIPSLHFVLALSMASKVKKMASRRHPASSQVGEDSRAPVERWTKLRDD
ncbi:hypothetical protein Taro_031086 [Colocasia esculenta]|uniref:Uncharacterized protein n=1 Tax=Colocasia esculenta TaxID=4460 RepID=A0A843W5B9_COLES|nr:hypothetical protein [Colocasia esculenta]